MTAEIISVGTELLLGDILNTNAQYLAQQLAALGFTVHFQSVVGDNPARLRNFLQAAKDRSDILLLTGGLGPTDDDITKETAALVFGDTLVMDPEELAALEAFFAGHGREMTDNNRKQAMVPKNGRKLPNPNGTAPGVCFRSGGKYAFLLPGPPSEMVPMFEASVLPALQAMQDSSIRSLTLRVVGIGESELENRAYQLLINDNPTAALYAKTGEVHIRITAKALTAAQAEVMCAEYAQMFRELLGKYIYGEENESLEAAAVNRLVENGETVATAESCTGGMLSQRITSVPGSSAVFGYGAITYANEVKQQLVGVSGFTLRRHGAVSSQVAAEMAFGALKKGRADYGIGITGIAGPDGGTSQKPVGLVYVAVASGGRVYVRKLNAGQRGRDYIRTIATQNALDMLRRLASGYTVPEAKTFRKSEIADYERQSRASKKSSGIIRAVVSIVLTLALLAGLLLGFNALQAGRAGGAGPDTPGATGLSYGTEEYAGAAMAYVAALNRENPAVTGFLAFSGELVEHPVERVTTPQSQLTEAARRQDRAQLAAVSAEATPGRANTNTAIAGSEALVGLYALLDASNMEAAKSFRYYTALDEQVYQVYAIFELDESDDYGDGFFPLFTALAGEESYIQYALGAKMRSRYEIATAPAAGDSLMTLCIQSPSVEGRRLYICGRLCTDEQAENTEIAPAGQPLLPRAEYDTPPDVEGLYAHWLSRMLLAGLDYSTLQLAAGIPAADTAPFIPPEASDELIPTGTPSPTPEPTPEDEEEDKDAADAVNGEGEEEEGEETEATPTPTPTPSPTPAPTPTPENTKPDPDVLTVTLNGEVLAAPVGEVLAAICQYEGANLADEAVKALAICAHSWILNQQGAGNAAPEVLGALPSERILALVAEVEQLMITPEAQEDTPAFTPWHAMSARATISAEDIFGSGRGYLTEVTASEELMLPGWRQTLRVSPTQLKEAVLRLGAKVDDSLPTERWLGAVNTADSGYVQSFTLFGQNYTGLQLWQNLLDGDGKRLMDSPAFELSFTGEEFLLVCYGKGHGCGLSLAGANLKAHSGWDYARILAHYFPGSELHPW